MRRKSPTDLAASVRQRLLNIARASGEELQLLLTRYGVERLLYRLGRTAAIAATFARRGTPLPEDTPLALTERFARDPAKQAQWRAFIERGRLLDVPADLGVVVQRIGAMVLPAARAANDTELLHASWTPGGDWVLGRTEAGSDA